MSPTTTEVPAVEETVAKSSVEKAPPSKKPKAANANASSTRNRKAKNNGPDTKGVDTKAPVAAAGQEKTVWQVVLIRLELIEASPFQPRLSFDEAEMQDLVASVREHGVQQPIIVRTRKEEAQAQQLGANTADDDGIQEASCETLVQARQDIVGYELVAGERRWRASKEARRKFIPAIIRDDLTDMQAAELALFENIQRSNLTVIEEARGYKRLMLEFRLSEKRIAKKVGKSVQVVRDTIKLLALPEAVQTLMFEKKLTASHGHALLAFARFETVCVKVAERVMRDRLTAASLATDPLPNARELKASGLIVELDHHTEFDWKTDCRSCPFKAYAASGHRSYCLRPDEWNKKQIAAVEIRKQEATRILEAAREQGKQAVSIDQLPTGSYRDLSYGTPPQGCSPACPCRSESCDPRDPTQSRPVCLDPRHYNDLIQAERKAQEEARSGHFIKLWTEAKLKLATAQEDGAGQTVISLLAYSVLLKEQQGYDRGESGPSLLEEVAAELSIELPWDRLLDAGLEPAAAWALLSEADPGRLLLLIACLQLGEEAANAIHYQSPTPLLDAVLGRSEAVQAELVEVTDEVTDEEEGPEDELAEDESKNAVNEWPLDDGSFDREPLNDELRENEALAPESTGEPQNAEQIRSVETTTENLPSPIVTGPADPAAVTLGAIVA